MCRVCSGACDISAMPPALSVIGPNVSIARTYATVVSMPIVATAVPKMPAFWPGERRVAAPACEPKKYDRPSATAMMIAVTPVLSKPTAMPEMMFVAGPVREARASSCTGRQLPAV